MLEEEGKAAVIVSEGLLFNSGRSHKEVRKMLIMDCELEGVVSLPEGVFQPYTGVKTSILIFKKRKAKNKSQDINVWFYGMASDGYSLDANRRRLKNKPLPITISEWRTRNNKNQENRQLDHFAIPFDEIEKNGFELNFNLYQDFIYEPQKFWIKAS
jgi:type I restriction enzyme M protein